MSVIVRDPFTDKITLYCKGADTILFERLHSDCDDLKEKTQHQLYVIYCIYYRDNRYYALRIMLLKVYEL